MNFRFHGEMSTIAAVVGWLGVWVAKGERERVERFEELLIADLDEVAGSIANFIEALERELLSIVDVPDLNAETISLLGEGHGIIQQPFLLDSAGGLFFPPQKLRLVPMKKRFWNVPPGSGGIRICLAVSPRVSESCPFCGDELSSMDRTIAILGFGIRGFD